LHDSRLHLERFFFSEPLSSDVPGAGIEPEDVVETAEVERSEEDGVCCCVDMRVMASHDMDMGSAVKAAEAAVATGVEESSLFTVVCG